jgi:hypothetical protein
LAVGVASSTFAGDFQVRFRYKDTIWNDAGGVIPPETPTTPPEDHGCPAPAGMYVSVGWSEVADGCLYREPKVEVGEKSLPLELARTSVSRWCGDVYAGSRGVKAVEVVDRKLSATASDKWVELDAAVNTNGIVCSRNPDLPEIADVTPVRAGTLKNADMERWGYIDVSDWSGGYASGSEGDRDIGGLRNASPYDRDSQNQTLYQDVPVSDELASRAFPVAVRWLQTTKTTGNFQAAIRLQYLDRSKQVIGASSSPPASSPRALVFIDRSLSGAAPIGTKYIRVNMDFTHGRAAIDNVALNVDGVEVSEINGGFGMPLRPQDFLRNSGAEQGTAGWKALDFWLSTRTSITNLNDPLGILGSQSFTTYPYNEQTHYQQVWLSASQRGKPITVKWHQGGTAVGTIPDMVKVRFYTKDGSDIGVIQGGQSEAIPGFWQHRRLTGVVPVDADFMIVDMYFKDGSRHFLDNVTLNIAGAEFAQIASTGPQAVDYCPHYVNTVNGPGDNAWWSELNASARGYVRIDPQADGWTSPQYKSYCVAPGGRYLVANYSLQAYRAWAGFEYEAFDINGARIGSKRSLHDTEKWDVAEDIWEVYELPAGTAFLKKTLIDLPKTFEDDSTSNYFANYTRRVLVKDIDFTMNGELPSPPATLSVLRNGGAEIGTKYWTQTPYSGGVLTLLAKDRVTNVSSKTAGTVTGTVSTSNISCEGICVIQPSDFAFYASAADGEFYQDVLVAAHRFPTGSPVNLSWELGVRSGVNSKTTTTTSGGTTTSTSTLDMDVNEVSAGVALEFYDVNDNLLGSASSPMSFNPWVFFDLDVKREMTSALPAGTWKVRVLMKGLRKGMAAIDNIQLGINGKAMSRLD